MKTFFKYLLAILILSHTTSIFAQEENVEDLLELSFEDLLNMEVTSVSKKSERIQDVPSSIYLITSADIENSAANNIAELLREMVPGFWTVSNDYMNNDSYIRSTTFGSALYLLDGTPINDLMTYTLVQNNLDLPLQMIDRIEVIKGSGGTVYGANSASGVVSIFTKDPEKMKPFFVEANVSAPLHSTLNLGLQKNVNSKIDFSVYGKYRYFEGFDQMDVIENTSSTVPSSYTEGNTTITNRFTGDDNTYNSYTLGGGLTIKASDKLKISSKIHYNSSWKDKYTNYFPTENMSLKYDPETGGPQPFGFDTIYLVEDRKSMISAHVRSDYALSEKNNLFARISFNNQESFQTIGGGYNTKNGISDFEIQDNIELASNFISVGANYRFVNYDIFNIENPEIINYIDPQNTEKLFGLFAQDKISLLDNKLNIYLGIKAEQFSLINNDFYFSPMAKFTYSPNEKLTVWGGYTQAYTTPGYNETNVEMRLFAAESPKIFFDYARPQVYRQVLDATTDQFVQMGMDLATAENQAMAYLQSEPGIGMVDSITNNEIAVQGSLFPGHYSFAAINGPETKPTQFSNIELGARLQPNEKIYLETNLFISNITDGIINSAQSIILTSPTNPEERINAYYYGNYYKGTNKGIESIVKYIPTKKLKLELSHTLFTYDMEYVKNSDFDIDNLTESQKDLVDEDNPLIPKNIFRGKVQYNLPSDIRLSLSGVFATSYYNKFGTLIPFYQYDLQRFDPLYSDVFASNKTIIGDHDNRTIINFRIDKYFMDQQLDIYIYGNDILFGTGVESVNQLITTYPRQVGSMFGFGVAYNISK